MCFCAPNLRKSGQTFTFKQKMNCGVLSMLVVQQRTCQIYRKFSPESMLGSSRVLSDVVPVLYAPAQFLLSVHLLECTTCLLLCSGTQMM